MGHIISPEWSKRASEWNLSWFLRMSRIWLCVKIKDWILRQTEEIKNHEQNTIRNAQ